MNEFLIITVLFVALCVAVYFAVLCRDCKMQINLILDAPDDAMKLGYIAALKHVRDHPWTPDWRKRYAVQGCLRGGDPCYRADCVCEGCQYLETPSVVSQCRATSINACTYPMCDCKRKGVN